MDKFNRVSAAVPILQAAGGFLGGAATVYLGQRAGVGPTTAAGVETALATLLHLVVPDTPKLAPARALLAGMAGGGASLLALRAVSALATERAKNQADTTGKDGTKKSESKKDEAKEPEKRQADDAGYVTRDELRAELQAAATRQLQQQRDLVDVIRAELARHSAWSAAPPGGELQPPPARPSMSGRAPSSRIADRVSGPRARPSSLPPDERTVGSEPEQNRPDDGTEEMRNEFEEGPPEYGEPRNEYQEAPAEYDERNAAAADGTTTDEAA